MAGILRSCSGYAGFWPWLLAAGRGARKTQIYARFCVIPGFWPRWALSWPESCVAVPATLVFGLGCLPRGSVVAGILRSCSGYAGFWPWLLAAGPWRQENAKTRVDHARFCVLPGFCAITALLVRGMELMEAYTHSYPCMVCIAPRKAVAEVSLTEPKTASPNKRSGGRKRKEQSTPLTQSSGQAPLETQHFGRTTALQKGPGRIRTPGL